MHLFTVFRLFIQVNLFYIFTCLVVFNKESAGEVFGNLRRVVTGRRCFQYARSVNPKPELAVPLDH